MPCAELGGRIGMVGLLKWLTVLGCLVALGTLEAKRQPLVPIQPVNPFVVITPALSLELDMHTPVTVMKPREGDLAYPHRQCR